MDKDVRFRVVFFRTTTGAEPVRDWLKELDRNDRKTIGEDIKTVQFGWPIGLPLVRMIDTELWEVRSRLHRRIARVIFTIHDELMILQHGFLKKSQKTPASDLGTARNRLKQFKDQAS